MRVQRLLFVAGLLLTAAKLPAAEITVFAAASLSDSLRELAAGYKAATGDVLYFNLGASSVLEVQLKHGAPADVFFSADEAKMDTLDRAGLIAGETRRSLLSNTLVIIVNATAGATVKAPADLARPTFGRIALAETETVPAGIYAKAFLTKAGLWPAVAPRVVPTENVRACLAAVESGNVAAGIVYRTDALISSKVRVAYEIPADKGPAISYPVAVLGRSREPEAARRFVDYLCSPAARAHFAKFGFRSLP